MPENLITTERLNRFVTESILEYIADSPPSETGGFDGNTVNAANTALEAFAVLDRILALCVRTREHWTEKQICAEAETFIHSVEKLANFK